MRQPNIRWETVASAKAALLVTLQDEIGDISFIELSIALGQVFNEVAKTNAAQRMLSGKSPFNPDALGREDASS